MESSSASARVLVVAAKTAATPQLLDAVRERAAQGMATFTLLVPNPTPHGLHKVVDPEDQGTTEAHEVLELALPLLQKAAGARVEGKVGAPMALEAIQDELNLNGPYDELIISTLPTRVSKWLHLDLPHKAAGLGLPVTVVTAQGTEELPPA